MTRKLRRILTVSVLVGMSACPLLRAQNPVPAAPRSLLSGYSPGAAAAANSGPSPAATSAPALSNQSAPAAPNAGGPAAANQQVAAAGADYVLAASDIVEMSIFREPDLTTQTRIASDGSAQFPLIGEVKIAGMAMRDAREMIRRRYNADYLVEPQVYLNVVGYANRKFTILGQVAKPGAYDFPPGEHLTLLEAVGMAGGFTRLADEGGIRVKRSAREGEQTLKVNARKLTLKNSTPFEVAAGDVITVGESWF